MSGIIRPVLVDHDQAIQVIQTKAATTQTCEHTANAKNPFPFKSETLE